MRVAREELLRCLESVQAGLSPRDIIEQSSCFVFKEGKIYTYDDEVACRGPSPLDESFVGAVPHEKLLKVLQKLPEEHIEVSIEEGQLQVLGKGRKATFRLEADIVLPIDSIEEPGEWRPLHDSFAEAVQMVQHCAGRDDSQFAMTCLHLTKDHIEACDNFQVCRWAMPTGLTQEVLVRQQAIKHIVSLGMHEVSEGESWLHFRNQAGLMLSCRHYLEDFPEVGKVLGVEGKATNLPKALTEAASLASLFSSENKLEDQVLVEIRPGKLRITGVGISGSYQETKKLVYHGKPIKFYIAPELLADLVKRHSECIITPTRLKADTGAYQYVACLRVPETKSKAPERNGVSEETPVKKRKKAVKED